MATEQQIIEHLEGELSMARCERDHLLEVAKLAEATIVRLAPVYSGGFSSAAGTLDVLRAAIAKAEGGK
jgi:hypothetical protein